MNIFLAVLLFIVGVVLVIKGGDLFVDAATWIAERSGIPKVIIGATIVSLATTMPELLVSVMAATEGKVDMSIGNAVGSVTANIALIMAISLIFMPGVIKRKDYLAKSVLMVIAAALVAVSGVKGEVGLLISFVLMVVFFVFMYENIREVKKTVSGNKAENEGNKEKTPSSKKILAINITKFVVGALFIVLGSRLLVDKGSLLARMAGVPERVIGVTFIAVGTSLPELITTVTAIVKKESSLSIGNILGANIIDLTLIMPLSALISGKALPVSPALAQVDLPFCLIVCLIAVLPAMIRSKFSRWQGVLLLASYASYLAYTFVAA